MKHIIAQNDQNSTELHHAHCKSSTMYVHAACTYIVEDLQCTYRASVRCSFLSWICPGGAFCFRTCLLRSRGKAPSLSAYRRVICLRRASTMTRDSLSIVCRRTLLFDLMRPPKQDRHDRLWGSPIPSLAAGLDPSLMHIVSPPLCK